MRNNKNHGLEWLIIKTLSSCLLGQGQNLYLSYVLSYISVIG